MSSRLLARLFSALALAAIALISAPLTARADTGEFTAWHLVDDNGRDLIFSYRATLETAAVLEASSSGSAGVSSLTNGRIGDISLSGSTGSMAVSGTLGQSFASELKFDSINLLPYSTNYSVSATYGGTSKPSWYWFWPYYRLTSSPSGSVTGDLWGHLTMSGRSINASIDSSNLKLSDSNGFSLGGSLGARSLSLASNASSTSALTTCDFISNSSSGTLKVNSGSRLRVYTYLFDPNSYAQWLGGSSIYFYKYDGVRATQIFYLNPDRSSFSIDGRVLSFYATVGKSYNGSPADIVASFPHEYGIGVTQASFLSALTDSTNSINQTATNNSNREIKTYMDTTGSNTVVGDVLGGSSSSDMSDSMGVGDALGIASGGLSSMLGRSASGVVSFSGLKLGAEFGNFEIPAFSVDIWSWCPSGLATTIKTGFTAVAVISWAVGMKRFFDRIFHGEQVVSVE